MQINSFDFSSRSQPAIAIVEWFYFYSHCDWTYDRPHTLLLFGSILSFFRTFCCHVVIITVIRTYANLRVFFFTRNSMRGKKQMEKILWLKSKFKIENEMTRRREKQKKRGVNSISWARVHAHDLFWIYLVHTIHNSQSQTRIAICHTRFTRWRQTSSSLNCVSTFSVLCFRSTFVCLLFCSCCSCECGSICVLQSIEVHTCRSFETTKGCTRERKSEKHFIIECNDGTNWG